MNWLRSRARLVLLGLGMAGVVLFRQGPAWTATAAAPDKAAVERTRAIVHMLDDLHKAYVVNITEVYVKARERTPAARVAKRVFKHMADKGWHTGRLIDATGEPINEANRPISDFEKRAVVHLKKGQSYFEEIASRNGKPVLRAATVVPAVMNQCLACHPGHKKGDLLGALVYEVPIK